MRLAHVAVETNSSGLGGRGVRVFDGVAVGRPRLYSLASCPAPTVPLSLP